MVCGTQFSLNIKYKANFLEETRLFTPIATKAWLEYRNNFQAQTIYNSVLTDPAVSRYERKQPEMQSKRLQMNRDSARSVLQNMLSFFELSNNVYQDGLHYRIQSNRLTALQHTYFHVYKAGKGIKWLVTSDTGYVNIAYVGVYQ
jgi:hypothetical protein